MLGRRTMWPTPCSEAVSHSSRTRSIFREAAHQTRSVSVCLSQILGWRTIPKVLEIGEREKSAPTIPISRPSFGRLVRQIGGKSAGFSIHPRLAFHSTRIFLLRLNAFRPAGRNLGESDDGHHPEPEKAAAASTSSAPGGTGDDYLEDTRFQCCICLWVCRRHGVPFPLCISSFCCRQGRSCLDHGCRFT
jgi:hypothetical protein